MRGISRSETMMAGRNVVTFRSASSPLTGLFGRESPGAHELGQTDPRGGIVLDDEDTLRADRPIGRAPRLVFRRAIGFGHRSHKFRSRSVSRSKCTTST